MYVIPAEIKSDLIAKVNESFINNGFPNSEQGTIIDYTISAIDDKIFSSLEKDILDEVINALADFNKDMLDDVPPVLDDILDGTIDSLIKSGQDLEKIFYYNLMSLLLNVMEFCIMEKA